MLDYFALFLVFFVFLTLFYSVIVTHDIPYEIAKHRNHPLQDAIHVAGWVSLFTLHAIWPFLWIWATLYKPNHGWGMSQQSARELEGLKGEVRQLKLSLATINKQQAGD